MPPPTPPPPKWLTLLSHPKVSQAVGVLVRTRAPRPVIHASSLHPRRALCRKMLIFSHLRRR